MAQVIWNPGTITQGTTPKIPRKDDGWYTYPASCGEERGWYHYFVYYTYYHTPCFFQKFVIFRFAQILKTCCFSSGNDETQTHNPTISRQKPNWLCLPPRIEDFWVQVWSLPCFMHALNFPKLCLLEFLRNKQNSVWISNQ